MFFQKVLKWLVTFSVYCIMIFIGIELFLTLVNAVYNSEIKEEIFNDRYRPVFASIAEKVEFQKLLAEHGLDNDISCIEIVHGKMFFYRNGKRCELKSIGGRNDSRFKSTRRHL